MKLYIIIEYIQICLGFYYTFDSANYSLPTNFIDIKVSNKWYDRKDSLTILAFFCCVVVTTLWLVNLFTSMFKKGGLLGGLF